MSDPMSDPSGNPTRDAATPGEDEGELARMRAEVYAERVLFEHRLTGYSMTRPIVADLIKSAFREGAASRGRGDAPDVPDGDRHYAVLVAENVQLFRELNRLYLLINSPQTADFLEAVRVEAAHQAERWGVEHDAGKRPEDWVTLTVYLLGKASRAHFDGEQTKLLHHVVTLAAVALNWHRALTGESTSMRPGVAGGNASMRPGVAP